MKFQILRFSSVDRILKIEMFSKMQSEAKNPSYTLISSDAPINGQYDETRHTVFLFSRAFGSWVKLAATIGHEFQHSIHYNSKNLWAAWANHRISPSFQELKAYSEFKAYYWEVSLYPTTLGKNWLKIWEGRAIRLINTFGRN